MDIRWRVVTPPGEEPVTTAEAKAQSHILHTAEDSLIAGKIATARQMAESYLGRALITQTREATLDRWPSAYGLDEIELPGGVVQSITSVKYTDPDGAEQTWGSGNYVLDTSGEPHRLYAAYGVSFPSIRSVKGAVRIRYVAGYGLAAAVPQGIKDGILLVAAHLVANREQVVVGTIATELPMGAEACWAPFRLRTGVC